LLFNPIPLQAISAISPKPPDTSNETPKDYFEEDADESY